MAVKRNRSWLDKIPSSSVIAKAINDLEVELEQLRVLLRTAKDIEAAEKTATRPKEKIDE